LFKVIKLVGNESLLRDSVSSRDSPNRTRDIKFMTSFRIRKNKKPKNEFENGSVTDCLKFITKKLNNGKTVNSPVERNLAQMRCLSLGRPAKINSMHFKIPT
jgi:hypothetical protein